MRTRTGATTRALGALAAAWALFPLVAARADASGLDWLPSQWQAGGFVLATPKYDGSGSYRVIGFPVAFPAGAEDGDGRVQFKGIEDIRIRLLQHSGFEIGPLAGWRFGRDEDDDRRLVGLGDLDGGLVIGGYAAYRLGNLAAFTSYHHQVTGDDTGGFVRFGVEGKTRILPWLFLTGVVGATWASRDYMDSYFGVSQQQSLTSGLGPYDAAASIKDVYVGLTASVPLDDRWTLRLAGRYSHLVGDAADSPIVERESQLSGGLGLTYRFSIR